MKRLPRWSENGEVKIVAKLALVLLSASAWSTLPPVAGGGSTASHSPDTSHSGVKVAIAWLSDVRGEVQLAPSTGREFHPASVHIPMTSGNVIQTAMGRAEVEFEDNSSVRLGPYSSVEFSRLELLPSGVTASNVHVLKGTVYASLIPAYVVHTKGNDCQLIFGQQHLHLQPSSHIRLELDATEARLAVLDGTGRVDGPFGSIELVKKRTFTFSFAGESQPVVVKKVVANPMDAWDRSAVALHQNNAKLGRPGRRLFEQSLSP
jgi:FecR protein